MSKTKTEDEFINRDDLRDYIHNIHNMLRNKGAGYGQNGLKIFSVFYGLKLIQSQLNSLGLTEEQQKILDFNELVRRAKLKDEIIEYIDTKVLSVLWDLRSKENKENKTTYNLGHFLFYQIPKDLEDGVWKNLILKINRVPVGYKGVNKVNLSGKVWEYFVGRDSSAISELGAYFSDRHIVLFCLNKVKPTVDENGMVRHVVDMFGGSGGFTLGFASYMRDNYPDIKWKNNVNNIFHFDMEQSVVNMTGLEMFAITGYFPSRENNYTRGNSFVAEFAGSNNMLMKWFYIFTNPPYGGDKTNKSAEQIKRDKLITFIKNIEKIPEKLNEQLKQLMKESNDYKKLQEKQQVNLDSCSKRINNFASTNGITTANDKESCSLILLMDCLAEGGTCCGILKEGVFFDGKYSPIRKVLIENFNVTNVISVPQNAFENTSTKTSIIIFHNTGKTKKVVFSELVVELEEQDVIEIGSDGMVHMIKNKDEIKEVVEKEICTATYEMISKPTIIMSKGKKAETKERFDYSLNYKDYKDFKVVCPDGYELKKLGDICEIIDGFAFKSSDFVEKGIPLIQISNINNYMIDYSDNYKKVKKDPKYNKYLVNKNDIVIGMTGNIQEKIAICNSIEEKYLNQRVCALRNFKNDNLRNYVYVYWNKMNIGSYFQETSNGSLQKNLSKNDLQNLQIPVPKDLTKLKKPLESLEKLHQSITEATEVIPQKEKAMCDLIKKLTDEGTKDVDYETFKLGDVCEVKAGPYLKSYNNGEYPIYGGGNSSGTIDRYTHENDWIIHKDGISKKIISFVRGKFFINHHGWSITTKNNISKTYIGYYIKNLTQDILDKLTFSVQKGLNQETFYSLQINILKPAVIKKHKLQELFDEVDKMKETLETNKKEYNEQIDKLFDTKDVEEEKAVEVTIKTKTKKSKNKEVQEIEI